jgi:hypothetical protein
MSLPLFGTIFAIVILSKINRNCEEETSTRSSIFCQGATEMLRFPNLLILPDKVYSLSIEEVNSKRASDRFLIDHRVRGVNFSDPFDAWMTSLAVSKEFLEDYGLYKLKMPLEWLLIRFLRHHAETDSLSLLSSDDGQVLTSSNFREYVGREFTSTEAEEILRTLIQSLARAHPGGAFEFRDLFVSTDFTLKILASSLRALISEGHIKELGQYVYMVK